MGETEVVAPELVNEGVRDVGVGAKGNPEGVEAAVFRSSAAFLVPPSMLKGRNHPEGAGAAAPEAAEGVALVEAVAPAARTQSMKLMHTFSLYCCDCKGFTQ